MNIFDKVNSIVAERRRNKLRKDLEAIASCDLQYDPFRFAMPEDLIDKNAEISALVERLTWYSGDGNALHDYYTNNRSWRNASDVNMKESYFWAAAPSDMRHVHSGVPQLISETMGSILFRTPFIIDCEVKNENGEIDKTASDYASQTITELCDQLKLNELCYKSAVINSYCGHSDFKLSCDLSLDYKPIIDVYDRRFFSIRKVRGIPQEHVYSQWYTDKKNQKTYLLEEVYGKNENGYATIEYHLYERKADKRTEVPLSTLPETENLEDAVLGITGFASYDIPNLASANVRVDYPYGKSDYEGAIDLFDTLDEDVTQIVKEIRDKTPIREFDERMLDIDSEGNKRMLAFVTNFIKSPHDNTENAKGVATTEFTDETVNHVMKFQWHLSLACAKVKISPISLGIPGLNAIDASDKSTREKSKVTTETRNTKIMIWKPFLEKFIKKVLNFSKWLTTKDNYPVNDIDAIEWKNKLDSINLDGIKINITFPDYINDSVESKVQNAINGLSGGVYSLETAIDTIHGKDWTEFQKKEEINRILYRQGMSSDVKELEELENGAEQTPTQGENNNG